LGCPKRAFASTRPPPWSPYSPSRGSTTRAGRPPILCRRTRDRGDLTPLLSGYFDTTTGSKGEARTYCLIATALGEEPSAGLFVSDAVTELDAARAAGFSAALAVRVPPAPVGHGHRAIASFDALP
jgi:methionine salvage enolase-phosphatase E1